MGWLADRLGLNRASNPGDHETDGNVDPDKEEVRRRQDDLQARLERLRIESEVRARRGYKTTPE